MAKTLVKFGSRKRYAEGGEADRGQARYGRKTADIESDYQKALKAGKNADVAKAKYEQRMADAKDDLAKWTGGDRTQTRAAEAAAEQALTIARRTKGANIANRDRPSTMTAERMAAPKAAEVDVPNIAPKLKTPTKRAAPVRRPAAPVSRPTAPAAPAPRAERAAPPAGKGKEIVVTGEKPRGNTAADRRERMGAVLAAPFKAAARYNPLSLAASAIFDGKPSKPSAPKARSASDAQRKADYLKRAADIRAKGGPEGSAKFYEREASYLKKGGTAKGYAKGGSIDGCAVRGKTRAPGAK